MKRKSDLKQFHITADEVRRIINNDFTKAEKKRFERERGEGWIYYKGLDFNEKLEYEGGCAPTIQVKYYNSVIYNDEIYDGWYTVKKFNPYDVIPEELHSSFLVKGSAAIADQLNSFFKYYCYYQSQEIVGRSNLFYRAIDWVKREIRALARKIERFFRFGKPEDLPF